MTIRRLLISLIFVLKITYLSNKVGMSYTSGILKHTQIRKFIMMLGEIEKTSPKIEKCLNDFWKKINTVRTSFEPAVKLCKFMLISTSGSLPHVHNLDTWESRCFRAKFYSLMFCINLEWMSGYFARYSLILDTKKTFQIQNCHPKLHLTT